MTCGSCKFFKKDKSYCTELKQKVKEQDEACIGWNRNLIGEFENKITKKEAKKKNENY